MLKFKKRIVIGGPPRTGSTLLRFILDASTDLLTLPETNFFTLPLWQRQNAAAKYSAKLAEKLDISPEDIEDSILSSSDSVSAFDKIARYVAEAKKISAGGWVEKSPPNCFHYHRLAYENRDVLFLSIVRNGLDVVTSRIGDHPSKGDAYWCTIQCYIDSMAAVYNYESPKHYIVKYEELVSDPVTTLNRLSKFLGMELRERGLQEFYQSSVTRDFSRVHQEKLKSPLSEAWIERWRAPEHEIRVKDFLGSPQAVAWMKRSGYEAP